MIDYVVYKVGVMIVIGNKKVDIVINHPSSSNGIITDEEYTHPLPHTIHPRYLTENPTATGKKCNCNCPKVGGADNEEAAPESDGADTEGENLDSSMEKVKNLDSFLNEASTNMNKLLYAEQDLPEDLKTQFDWVHWKFYRLWTLEKLHPILKMPFDMVDPMLRPIGFLLKNSLHNLFYLD